MAKALAAARAFVAGRVYYGWYIVAVAFLSFGVSVGLTAYTLGAFLRPMSTDLGWSVSTLVAAQSLSTVVSGLAAFVIGPVIDRRGSRALMVGGAVLAGLALLALAFITEPWHFYLLRGLLFPLGIAGMSGIVATTAVANWFVRQRGRAIAAASLGLSIANIVFPPLAAALIENVGWRIAWATLGVLVMALVIPPAALLMKRRPEDMGLLPDGDLPGQPPPPPVAGARPVRSAAAEYSFTRAEAVRTRALWLIVGSFTLANMGLSAMAVHLIPYFQSRGLSAGEAAWVYGLQGVTSLLIKPVWGMLAERMDGRYLALMEFGACTAGILLLLAADSLAGAVLGIAVFGTGIGGVVIIMEVVWADAFGRRHLGAVRSLATPFTIVASSGAPLFASAVFDATGSYQGAFLSFIVAFAGAAALILAARPPRAPESTP